MDIKLALQLINMRVMIIMRLLPCLATYDGIEFLDRLRAADCPFKTFCER